MEEQDGFTFVDKRNKATTAESEATISEVTPDDLDTSEVGDFDDDEDVSDQTPSVYSMVMYTLQMFVSTAWFKLGLMADPSTGSTEANLPEAKVAIDVVGDLVGRLEGAPEHEVPAQQIRELKRVLNDLRLNFVSRQNSTQE